jgi:short-subunit dehydrogenase
MIVIAGASSGLGAEVARIYKGGKKVINVSRRPSKYVDVNIICDLREGAEIQRAALEIIAIDEPL